MKTPGMVPGATEASADRAAARRDEPSTDFEIFRGRLAAISDELILDDLPLVESAEAGAFDGRNVHEHVLVPGRGPDEPVALSWIEPLDGALLHRLSPGF